MNERKIFNILVVEDEKPLAEVIKIKLEKSGFNAVTARTVEQSCSYLEEINIDIIWLDHFLLGKENGLDFMTKTKCDGSKWKDIPVFVVSNTASEDNVNTYLRLGAEKYYVKANARLDDIIKDIRDYLEKKNSR